jgi:hypothetical protein
MPFFAGVMGGSDLMAAEASVVMIDRFRGRAAQAFIESWEEETGAFTFTDVTLVDGRSKTRGAKWVDLAELSVSMFEEEFDEEGFTYTEWFGMTQLDPASYSLPRSLGTASVAAEVTLMGQRCSEYFDGEDFVFECEYLGEMVAMVEVEWTGEGPIVTTRSRSSDAFEDARFHFKGRSTARMAEVSGQIGGDGMVWELDGAEGSIARNAAGSWSWMRSEMLIG